MADDKNVQAKSVGSEKSSPKSRSPKSKSPPKSPPRDKSQEKKAVTMKQKAKNKDIGPCPWMCHLVPVDLPPPDSAQTVLHPSKDVFILKVAKVGANGDRRCKMELELVTPKGPEKQTLCRIDTRETQCDPDPPPCTCCPGVRSKKKK